MKSLNLYLHERCEVIDLFGELMEICEVIIKCGHCLHCLLTERPQTAYDKHLHELRKDMIQHERHLQSLQKEDASA